MPSTTTTPFGLRLTHEDGKRMRKLAKRLGCTPSAAAQKCAVSGLDELEGITDQMTNPIIAMCFQLASCMTNDKADHAEFRRILESVQVFKRDQADKRAGQGFISPELAT